MFLKLIEMWSTYDYFISVINVMEFGGVRLHGKIKQYVYPKLSLKALLLEILKILPMIKPQNKKSPRIPGCKTDLL